MLCKFFPSFPALVSTYPRYCRTISKVLTKLQLAAAYFFSPFRGEFSCILDGWESQSCFSLNFPTPTQYYTLWWPPKNSAKCRHVQLLRDIYSEKGEKLVSNYLSLIDFLHTETEMSTGQLYTLALIRPKISLLMLLCDLAALRNDDNVDEAFHPH